MDCQGAVSGAAYRPGAETGADDEFAGVQRERRGREPGNNHVEHATIPKIGQSNRAAVIRIGHANGLRNVFEFTGPVCMWPHGHPGDDDFHFCGGWPLPGKPYCAEHSAVAYIKPKEQKSNAA